MLLLDAHYLLVLGAGPSNSTVGSVAQAACVSGQEEVFRNPTKLRVSGHGPHPEQHVHQGSSQVLVCGLGPVAGGSRWTSRQARA